MSERHIARCPRLLPALVLMGCVLAGCEPASMPENTSGRIDRDPAADARGNVELIVVDRAGYDAAIAKQIGKVVLVDFWATWCGPCVEQLPHTIQTAERFADRGLAVFAVSFDDPDDSTRAADFLQSHDGHRVTNLISRFGASPQSIEAFEIEGGAVPHYKVYDRRGKLRHRFGVDPKTNRPFTLDDIDAAIEQLLSE